MSSSEATPEYVRAAAKALGLALDEAWVPAVALHLQRLLEARALLDECPATSLELAPRFEP